MTQNNFSLFGSTTLSNGLFAGTGSATMAAKASNRLPPLGRAFDANTGKQVNSTIDLYFPQGGGDPELMRQWHLTRLGDIGTVWNDFTGKGVSVGVYDEGTQQAHWDLDGNYDASKHVVIDGTVFDGGVPTGAHGTSVAGLIAAERNGRGGVGVAYDAKVTGVNIFDPDSPIYVNGTNGAALKSALNQGNQFDITNHSWGGAGSYGTQGSRSNPNSFSAFLADSFVYAAQTGRDGLGTITVMAAGNSASPGQADVGVTDRHAIAVGAYREADGVASYYSNSGAHLLVSAPSSDFTILNGTGQVTTDLLGTAGYNWSADPSAPNDYTDQFGGTSGATPIVSGVVALMLDANENLGWRDVQNILAASAKMPIAFETGRVHIDFMAGGQRNRVSLNEAPFKLAGQDANWNGGAMHYSNDYGYGAVDAYNATRMAEVWSLFSAPQTSANEVHKQEQVDIGLSSSLTQPANSIETFFTDIIGTPSTKSFTIDSDMMLERLDFTLNYNVLEGVTVNGQFLGETNNSLSISQIRLIAPDGTTAFTPVVGGFNTQLIGTEAQEFTLGFSGMRGVESKGVWTLDFTAFDSGFSFAFEGQPPTTVDIDNTLTINSVKMDMYGTEKTDDDVYTYTNEFFTMVDIAGQRGRQTLVDTDSGNDWINAAAVSSNVSLSLVAGQATTFGGERAFTINRSSVIENAVTGDGNDTLIGNRFDNFLVGMRGNDTLNGGNGNDWLIGGTGNDRFLFDNKGTSGKDLVLDFNRGDMIGTQTALRGAGADGKITVAASTLLLLDGTRTGDTAQLSEQGGAVIQAQGQKDGYFWYSFVSGTDIKMGDVIREASFQPEATAMGAVDAIAAMSAVHGDTGVGAATTGPVGDQGSFYLYDAMAGSMSGGVLLHA